MAMAVAGLPSANPALGNHWSWLDTVCAAVDVRELAVIEETGSPATVEPQHLRAIEAMIATRHACRSAVLIEAMRSFDADPRTHAYASAR